ncbi:MAG: hypothetical protein FWD29_02800 [Micrococcales bacterium]|nr:hypothetical protein [Micrococcales bacterium]
MQPASAVPRRKILFVAWGFPPFSGSGAWAPLGTVNAFARRGHDVTVLAADRWTLGLAGQFDPQSTKMVDPAVNVYRWPMPLGPSDPLIARWEATRAEAAFGPKPRHETWAARHKKWLATSQQRWSKVFPEPFGVANYARCYSVLTSAARHLHRAKGFDLVGATAGPWVDLSVVLHLGAEFGLPTFFYDRDAWLFRTFTGEEYPNAAEIEPLLAQILGQVTQAWYVNEPLADLHRKRFPDQAKKIKAVPNGWDGEFLPAGLTPPVRQPGKGLTFRYIGTITSGFPVEALTEGWKQARQTSEVVALSRLEFVGAKHGPAFDPKLGEFGIDHRDRISRTAMPDLYRQTDALVFMVQGGPLVTSSKIYEYIATGLPIVSATVRDHSARQVMAGRDLVFEAGAVQPDAIARAFVQAAERAPRPQETAQAHEHAEAFRRDRVLATAIEQLEEEVPWR